MGLRRLLVKMLDPEGGTDGQGIFISGGKFAVGGVPFDTEATIDAVAAALLAGTGVTVSYDDVAGTITIAASGGGGGGGGGFGFPFYAGKFYTNPFSVASSGVTVTSGVMQFHPLPAPFGANLDQVAIECVTTGTAQIHIGIYDSDSAGKPDSLVIDAGAFTAAAAGVRSATISTTLAAGLYWIGVLCDNSGTGTFRGASNAPVAGVLGYSAVVSPAALTRLETSGVATGSCPATAPAGVVALSSGTGGFRPFVRGA